MKRGFNWPLWSGLVLTVVAFISYYAFFARFPITRDIPWVSFALLLVAAVLLVTGWSRAQRKIVASIVAMLGFVVIAGFTFLVTVGSRNLPVAQGAPAVGEKAPEFTLPDTRNRNVSLSSLLADSNGVLLVFYRGYW